MFKGSGCAKCPVNQFGCNAKYRGSRCAELREKVGTDFDPMTNRDALHEISDELLAKELSKLFCRGYAEAQLLEWLQKPIIEEPINGPFE